MGGRSGGTFVGLVVHGAEQLMLDELTDGGEGGRLLVRGISQLLIRSGRAPVPSLLATGPVVGSTLAQLPTIEPAPRNLAGVAGPRTATMFDTAAAAGSRPGC